LISQIRVPLTTLVLALTFFANLSNAKAQKILTADQTQIVDAVKTTSTPTNRSSESTRAAVRELIGSIMVDGRAYDYDRELADGIGPRLTGSANYDRAVVWSMEQFRSLGLSNVHTESFTTPASWEPDVAATGAIIEPRRQTLHIYSAGWSPMERLAERQHTIPVPLAAAIFSWVETFS
jgi:hypothetical protein